MAGTISFKFGMWTPLPGMHLYSKIRFDQLRYHGATYIIYMKIVFSFSLPIYSPPVSWATQHITMCLIACEHAPRLSIAKK